MNTLTLTLNKYYQLPNLLFLFSIIFRFSFIMVFILPVFPRFSSHPENLQLLTNFFQWCIHKQSIQNCLAESCTEQFDSYSTVFLFLHENKTIISIILVREIGTELSNRIQKRNIRKCKLL